MQIPLLMSQNQITNLASVGETASRIVLVFAKNANIDPTTHQPTPDGTEGIYKVDLDKNNPIPNIETIPLLDNASLVVPSAFYNDKPITVLGIITDKSTEQIGVSYVSPDPDPTHPERDKVRSGKIIGDAYNHCPLTPMTVNGRITNMGGKFYTDGDHLVTLYYSNKDGVDRLVWLTRH